MPTVSIPIDVCRSGVRLTPAAKAVLFAILSYGEGPRPSMARIAEDAGVSLRHVYRAMILLRREGYLPANTPEEEVANTPPTTTGSGDIVSPPSDMMSPHSDIVSPPSDMMSPHSDIVSPSEAILAGPGEDIYIYNNNKYIERFKDLKDKKIEEDNKKKIRLSPSSFSHETPLDVGDGTDIEDTDARTALDCWNSSGHLAEWHYCEAWEAEYRRMREAVPEQELLLTAIGRFSLYQEGRRGREGGYGDNTRHFIGSIRVWLSDENSVKTYRSHCRRFWGEKTKGKKYRPYQDPRRETAPEPELEPVPASELIPLAEAEKDESHRTRCLAFLRGPEANDPQAREEFDRQTCVTIRREECDAGGDWEKRACERIEQHLMLDQRRPKRKQIEAPLMGMTN